jgi:photosystem II stability/assembly factor-like uncharacterized protein
MISKTMMHKLKMILTLNFFLCLTINPLALSQVTKQFEETSYYLNDVCFVNANTGWAVGDPHWDQSSKTYKGTLIKTVDGGDTWTPQDAGVSIIFKGVTFVDADNGWVVGENGTILHTSNGGLNWSQQPVATTDEFRGVAFTDTNNGWATSIAIIGQDWTGQSVWEGSVWHTSNGGISWNQQTLPANVGIVNRIAFIDANNGWIAGFENIGEISDPEINGAIYHTDDGGSTWTKQYSSNRQLVFTGIDFVDSNNGWAVCFKASSTESGTFIYHTSDGGVTWNPQGPDGAFLVFWDVDFIDTQKGCAVGFVLGMPIIYRTIDGGVTWQEADIPIQDDLLYGVAALEDKVLAMGSHDYLCIISTPWSADPLLEDSYLNTHYSFKDITFIDENLGWVVGQRTYKPGFWGQTIMQTSDGGTTWETQYEHAPDLNHMANYWHRLDTIKFVDSSHGWVTGYSDNYESAILYTSDGGLTWDEQGSALFDNWNLEFVASHFFDTQNGWALVDRKFPSSNLHFAKTLDGGITWEWVDTGIEGSINIGYQGILGDMIFTDTLQGWAVGSHDIVIHTEDGGITWSEQSLPYPEGIGRLQAVDFINNQDGWIGGANLNVTSDGGATWSVVDTDMPGDICDIKFFNSQNGWLVGDYGAIMHTIDGLNSGTMISSGTNSSLKAMTFITPLKGWAAGDQGTILSITSTVTPSDQYTITTATQGNGTITLDPDGGTYDEGTSVTITATADTDYRFDHWEGDVSGTTNPLTVTINGDMSVTAVFTIEEGDTSTGDGGGGGCFIFSAF